MKSPNYLRIITASVSIIVTSYLVLPMLFLTKDNGSIGGTSLERLSGSSNLKSRLLASELSWQLYVKKRKAIVRNHPEKVSPWSNPNQFQWEYFVPTFSCPHSIDRVGKLGDGGKFTCGIELFGTTNLKPCVVYSFGVSTQSSYEAEMLERTNCDIYAYDASVNKMGPEVSRNNPRVHFKKVFIGTKNETTLRFLMEQNGHDWIDFLKIDIEGSEFPVLNQVMKDFETLPFAQLSLEIHTDKVPFPDLYKLWERMEDKGLRAFKNEINFYPCVNPRAIKKGYKPFLMEYSFINLRGEHRIVSSESI